MIIWNKSIYRTTFNIAQQMITRAHTQSAIVVGLALLFFSVCISCIRSDIEVGVPTSCQSKIYHKISYTPCAIKWENTIPTVEMQKTEKKNLQRKKYIYIYIICTLKPKKFFLRYETNIITFTHMISIFMWVEQEKNMWFTRLSLPPPTKQTYTNSINAVGAHTSHKCNLISSLINDMYKHDEINRKKNQTLCFARNTYTKQTNGYCNAIFWCI